MDLNPDNQHENDPAEMDFFAMIENRNTDREDDKDFDELLNLCKKMWGNKLLLESKVINQMRKIAELELNQQDLVNMCMTLANKVRDNEGAEKCAELITAYNKKKQVVCSSFKLNGIEMELTYGTLEKIVQHYHFKENILFKKGDPISITNAEYESNGTHEYSFGEIVHYHFSTDETALRVQQAVVVSESALYVHILNQSNFSDGMYPNPRTVTKREISKVLDTSIIGLDTMRRLLDEIKVGLEINDSVNPTIEEVNEYGTSEARIRSIIEFNFKLKYTSNNRDST